MEKEKEPWKVLVLIIRITPWMLLLALPLLYVGNNFQLEQRLQYISSSSSPEAAKSRKVTQFNTTSTQEENQESLDFLLSRLIKGEELKKKMRETGLACITRKHSKHCVANRPLQIDTKTMTLTITTSSSSSSNHQGGEETMIIHPYARQEDQILLQTVTPVKLVHGLATSSCSSSCEYNHRLPAVIFSSSGFTGNLFHEFNEIIIPLFITASLFKSRVHFILVDYRPSFVTKYAKILTRLTSNRIINPHDDDDSSNRTQLHCFPGAVVGLHFHYHLTLNYKDIPSGLSMPMFKQFLRDSFNLKYSHVSQLLLLRVPPRVMLLSRTKTRRITNEDQVVTMMEDLGFRVVVVRRARVIGNLEVFSGMINACSVLVGVHGAGLTNQLFLPEGAVMVQLDLIGLEWGARTYYGDPARAMGLNYLRYRIEAEESSLLKVFRSKNHTAILNPGGAAFSVEAGKEVYLNGQNVRVNVERFRKTMVQAMSLITDDA